MGWVTSFIKWPVVEETRILPRLKGQDKGQIIKLKEWARRHARPVPEVQNETGHKSVTWNEAQALASRWPVGLWRAATEHGLEFCSEQVASKLIGRKELCVTPEMLSMGTPDAGIADKHQSLPWTLAPLDGQDPTQYLYFCSTNYHSRLIQCNATPRPYSNTLSNSLPDPFLVVRQSEASPQSWSAVYSELPRPTSNVSPNSQRLPASVSPEIQVNGLFNCQGSLSSLFASLKVIFIPVPFYCPASILFLAKRAIKSEQHFGATKNKITLWEILHSSQIGEQKGFCSSWKGDN